MPISCSKVDDIDIKERSNSCREVWESTGDSQGTLYAVCDAVRTRKTGEKSKNPGQEYAYLNLSDNSAALNNAVIWPEQYSKVKDTLFEGAVVKVITILVRRCFTDLVFWER